MVIAFILHESAYSTLCHYLILNTSPFRLKNSKNIECLYYYFKKIPLTSDLFLWFKTLVNKLLESSHRTGYAQGPLSDYPAIYRGRGGMSAIY